LARTEILAALIMQPGMQNPLDEKLWQALQTSHLRLASHVEFSEQLHRGQLWVIIRDPVRNQFYKTTPEIQQLLQSLDGKRRLDEILAVQPALQTIVQERAQALKILAQLLEAGLLQGDFNYDYGEDLERQRQKNRLMGKMRWQRPWMLKVPLFNPDRQLDWLYRKTRLIWTAPALLVWLLTMLAALVALVDHFPQLKAYWGTRFLDPVNLLLLVLVYPLLKAVHELSHGLTTKKWGGQVYEVGLMFLVFMPVPYVDASGSTQFPIKQQRMLVAAAGVMTELFCAALALFIWIASDSILVRDLCMNVMIIGAVSSVIFNGNPLLRFDAYYVLSDWLEIPNLGSRASLYLSKRWQHILLGVEPEPMPMAEGEKKWLLLYGVLSGTYRLVLSFSIALYIAGHYFFIGVLMALWAAVLQILMPFGKGLAKLYEVAKTHGRRPRFFLAYGAILALLYAGLFVVPVRHATQAEALLRVDGGYQIKAGAEGFLQEILVRNGEQVTAGQPLLVLQNSTLPAQLDAVLAQIAEMEILLSRYLTTAPDQAGFYRDQLQRLRQEEGDLRESLANLTVTSAVAGRVEIPAPDNQLGRYFAKGDVLGHVLAKDAHRLVALVPERLGDGVLRDVQRARVRMATDPGHEYSAVDLQAVPQAVAQLPDAYFGSRRGGAISVDVSDNSGTRALEPYFQVEMRLEVKDQPPPAGRGRVLFVHSDEPLGLRWLRQLRHLLLQRFEI
jgi:putative peptide zinc metalloprotease protein